MSLAEKRFYSWLSEDFTEDERIILAKHLSESSFKYVLGEGGFKQGYSGVFDPLTGRHFSYYRSPVYYLTYMAQVPNKELALKILKQAERLLQTASVIDIHFLYNKLAEAYNSLKDRKGQLYYCAKQIEIASKAAECFRLDFLGLRMPSHYGYSIISNYLFKNKHYRRNIRLCRKADKEGWAGNWQNRIEKTTLFLNNNR